MRLTASALDWLCLTTLTVRGLNLAKGDPVGLGSVADIGIGILTMSLFFRDK